MLWKKKDTARHIAEILPMRCGYFTKPFRMEYDEVGYTSRVYGAQDFVKIIDLNSIIVEKIKMEAPELIREFMKNDLVKMILYGSCARGDFKEYSDVDIALLTKGSRTDAWKYNDKIDEVTTKLAMKYFAVVNFVLLPYDAFEEKKSWCGYFKNIDEEGIKLYG